MARRSRQRKIKQANIPVVYRVGSETIRYVDQPLENLPKEISRLMGVMSYIRFLLDKVGRIKHPLVDYVRFQMEAGVASVPLPSSLTKEQCCQEIGRLNFILHNSMETMKKFTTPVPFFQEAAFKLKYGQTSRKREAGWNSFKRDRSPAPEPEAPEEPAEGA
jgi:hypothetical protein